MKFTGNNASDLRDLIVTNEKSRENYRAISTFLSSVSSASLGPYWVRFVQAI